MFKKASLTIFTVFLQSISFAQNFASNPQHTWDPDSKKYLISFDIDIERENSGYFTVGITATISGKDSKTQTIKPLKTNLDLDHPLVYNERQTIVWDILEEFGEKVNIHYIDIEAKEYRKRAGDFGVDNKPLSICSSALNYTSIGGIGAGGALFFIGHAIFKQAEDDFFVLRDKILNVGSSPNDQEVYDDISKRYINGQGIKITGGIIAGTSATFMIIKFLSCKNKSSKKIDGTTNKSMNFEPGVLSFPSLGYSTPALGWKLTYTF